MTRTNHHALYVCGDKSLVLLLVALVCFVAVPAKAATITPISFGSITSPATQDFSSTTPPQVLSTTDPLFTSIGIAMATPSVTLISTTDAYSFNDLAPSLFVQTSSGDLLATAFSATEATPESWTFDLIDPNGFSGYTEIGFSLVDTDSVNGQGTILQLDFFNNGSMIGSYTTTDIGGAGLSYGFQSDSLFDKFVVTFAGPGTGAGSDVGYGLDDLTLGGFVVGQVPEPSSLLLLGLGALGLVRHARRRRRRA